LDQVFSLLGTTKPIPKDLQGFTKTIQRARRAVKEHDEILEPLKTLTLFSLTPHQLKRVLFADDVTEGDPAPFAAAQPPLRR